MGLIQRMPVVDRKAGGVGTWHECWGVGFNSYTVLFIRDCQSILLFRRWDSHGGKKPFDGPKCPASCPFPEGEKYAQKEMQMFLMFS